MEDSDSVCEALLDDNNPQRLLNAVEKAWGCVAPRDIHLSLLRTAAIKTQNAAAAGTRKNEKTAKKLKTALARTRLMICQREEGAMLSPRSAVLPQPRAADGVLRAIFARLVAREPKKKIDDVRERCERALRARWPDATCEVFGSRRSSLATRNSDVDVCAIIPDEEKTESTAGKKRAAAAFAIERCLRDSPDFADVRAIARARVPVVKARDARTSLGVDVVVNNEIALRNSTLLGQYAAEDARARTLIILVKAWARRRLDDAQGGGLSSYAHAILAVHTLLRCRVVPNLLEDRPARLDDRRLGVAHLLYDHFRFLATNFDFFSDSISARTASLFPKSSWIDHLKNPPKAWRLSIEDPYEHLHSPRPHDLGDVMTLKGMDQLQAELDRAMDLLSHPDPNNTLASLFQDRFNAARIPRSIEPTRLLPHQHPPPPPPPPRETRTRRRRRRRGKPAPAAEENNNNNNVSIPVNN
ncbi:hypothetical protein CTAYLR_000039 [Chrysophaeum taylorii]|uniref:Polymerase nucleotidyl transferase domain-containing protein n=1 Tax=Chrysophaeum taylorii TaxID=2483200 RepID=A0AAD7UIC4_9STRA|nr:hypothetical protein CTAYLR_000039 [Chrysophaeum taylorii]